MASHLAALPTPAPIDPHVVAEVARDPNARGHVSVVHVLSSRCDCSRSVVEQIIRRGPIEGVFERILWVASDDLPPKGAIEKGFAVDIVPAKALEDRIGVIGAPTLIVANADGTIAYIGGYTRSKQSPISFDADVIKKVKRGDSHVDPLPVLGCAIDKKTARRLDPLGLR